MAYWAPAKVSHQSNASDIKREFPEVCNFNSRSMMEPIREALAKNSDGARMETQRRVETLENKLSQYLK